MKLNLSKNIRDVLNDGKSLKLDKGYKNHSEFRIPIDSDLDNDDVEGNDFCYKDVDVSDMTLDQIKDYVSKYTSGVKMDYECEETGSILVSFDQFVDMVHSGYHIIQSEVFAKELISIEYQKKMKRDRSR